MEAPGDYDDFMKNIASAEQGLILYPGISSLPRLPMKQQKFDASPFRRAAGGIIQGSKELLQLPPPPPHGVRFRSQAVGGSLKKNNMMLGLIPVVEAL